MERLIEVWRTCGCSIGKISKDRNELNSTPTTKSKLLDKFMNMKSVIKNTPESEDIKWEK
jgi:hypothetical protein